MASSLLGMASPPLLGGRRVLFPCFRCSSRPLSSRVTPELAFYCSSPFSAPFLDLPGSIFLQAALPSRLVRLRFGSASLLRATGSGGSWQFRLRSSLRRSGLDLPKLDHPRSSDGQSLATIQTEGVSTVRSFHAERIWHLTVPAAEQRRHPSPKMTGVKMQQQKKAYLYGTVSVFLSLRFSLSLGNFLAICYSVCTFFGCVLHAANLSFH